jgi:hypothetical protein
LLNRYNINSSTLDYFGDSEDVEDDVEEYQPSRKKRMENFSNIGGM